MTQDEFNLRLEAKRAREAEIAASFAAVPDGELETLLRDFIACKYLLDPEDFDTDELVALGEKSTAKIAGFQRSGLQFQEKSAGCTTASSGVIKKVLLAMAVGRLIGKKLDPDAVAEVTTISDLTELIIRTRAEA